MNSGALDVIPEFGSRLSYAVPRESENIIKEKARKSGVLPRVRDAPLKDQLVARIKEFQTNVELVAMLQRKRDLDTQMLQSLQAAESMDELTRTLAPPFRTGMADFAAAGSAAQRVAGVKPQVVQDDDADFNVQEMSSGSGMKPPATPGTPLNPGTPLTVPGTPLNPATPLAVPGTPLDRSKKNPVVPNWRDKSKPADSRDTVG